MQKVSIYRSIYDRAMVRALLEMVGKWFPTISGKHCQVLWCYVPYFHIFIFRECELSCLRQGYSALEEVPLN